MDEAYKLVIEAESQEMFSASYDWYKCLVEVLSVSFDFVENCKRFH